MTKAFAIIVALLLTNHRGLTQEACPNVEPINGENCTVSCQYGEEICCPDTGECASQTECSCTSEGQFHCTIPLLPCPSQCPDVPGAIVGSIDGGGVCVGEEQYLCEYYNITDDCYDPSEPEITTRCSQFGWTPFVYCEGSIYYDSEILTLNSDQPAICPETDQEPKQAVACGFLNVNFGAQCDYGGQVCCPESGECVATKTYKCNRRHGEIAMDLPDPVPDVVLRSRWDGSFEQQRGIQCTSVCPIDIPLTGSSCDIEAQFRCEYNQTINGSATCVCQRDEDWFCFDPNAVETSQPSRSPPPSPPTPPNPSLCPEIKPEDETCALINNGERCGYDGQVCCESSGECFPTTTCICKDDGVLFNLQDSWQCELTSFNCDALCPTDLPVVGDECELEDTIECDYELGACFLEGSDQPATTCKCLAGLIGSKWNCERNCVLPSLPGGGGNGETDPPTASFTPTVSPSLLQVPSLAPTRLLTKAPIVPVPSLAPTPSAAPSPRTRPTSEVNAPPSTNSNSTSAANVRPTWMHLGLLVFSTLLLYFNS